MDGQPFTLEITGLANPTWENELAIVVEGYRKLGLSTGGRILHSALFGDGQARATFGAMHLTGGAGFERGLGGNLASVSISRPENRWQGSNRGAWSNAGFDRLRDLYNTTLDPAARIQQLAQMEKIATEEVPTIPMYYQPTITPYVAGLSGAQLRTAVQTDTLLRIWEWEWR